VFGNNIFLKKVTIKQGYGVSGVSGVSDRLSKVGVISIPNFAFWNAKFEDEWVRIKVEPDDLIVRLH
jgi:hypothetical protein